MNNKKVKSLIFIPVLLGVLFLTLALVKQNQDTRKGAAGEVLDPAILMFDKQDVKVDKGNTFEVSLNVGTASKISAANWVVCYDSKFSISEDDIVTYSGAMDPTILEESSNKFFDEVRFTEVESSVDDQKCFSLTLLIEKDSSSLLGDTGEEKDILSLFKMKFLANEAGLGEVTLLANKSQMVGENVNSDNKEIELIDSSLKSLKVEVSDTGVLPPSDNVCNVCTENSNGYKGNKSKGDADCKTGINNIDFNTWRAEVYDIDDDDYDWQADFNCDPDDDKGLSRPDNIDFNIWRASVYDQ